MDLKRIARHILHTERALRHAFPGAALDAIGAAVAEGERRHSAELRVVIEGELSWEALLAGQSPRARAIEVFAMERVWDTAANNGVLLYVLMADRDVEVVADRGFNGRVAAEEWQAVCVAIERRFRMREFTAGTVEGVRALNELLVREFPAQGGGPDELPDRPMLR